MKLELWSFYIIAGIALLFAGLMTRCHLYRVQAITIERVDGGVETCTTVERTP